MAAASNGSKKPKTPDHRRTIIDTALAHAAENDWSTISLDEIAMLSDVPLIDLKRHFASRHEILVALARQVDADVLATAGDDLVDETVRDALFDLLMQRFDALEPYKPGLKRILAEARKRPDIMLPVLPQLARSMTAMLEASGQPAQEIRESARVAGLSLIWLSTMRVWIDDETADQSKTMAALDKSLSQAETLANSVNDGPGAFIRSMIGVLRPQDRQEASTAPSD
ncbi:MAG: TetR/AcrR family transcriptional regulator [Pseudomonadota bacterium]